jgi:formate dehydrogenase
MIVVGANPVVSKWSFLQVPNPSKHLKEMEARGAKLYFVDPRKTESAKVAGEHVFIRPNTDVFFYLSFLNEVIARGGVKTERVAEYMSGMEEISRLAKAWPAERSAEVTGIPAEILRQMVSDYLEANGAVLYSSTGVNMGANGTLAFWIQEVINAVSGNLDKRGGSLVGRGVIDFPKFGAKNGLLMREDRSRIGDFGSVNDAFPGGIMADEILTPGDKQLRALFVTGGNPLITMPNSNRLREAFSKLELLVTLDILPNETGALAHYMLPCTTPLERPDLPFIFPLMLGLQVKPYLQATKAVVKPEGEQRDEGTIYLDLCKASGVNLFGSAVAQRFFEMAKRIHSARKPAGEQASIPQEFVLSLLMRLTRQPSFRKLLKYPHGLLRDPHKETDFLGKRVLTPDGKMNLAPPVLMRAAEKLEDDFAHELSRKDEFRLISRRAVTTHNSWTHNFEDFVTGERRTNYLYMHPLDAEKLSLSTGDLADVSTPVASVRIPVKLLADLMPGTVALPHGWGHQASNLGVASQTSGVNVNILAADGPDRIDKVSGMAHLTGIPVEIRKSDGPQAVNSWSGLAQDVWEGSD